MSIDKFIEKKRLLEDGEKMRDNCFTDTGFQFVVMKM